MINREPAPGWGDFWGKWEDGSWEPDTKAWIQQLNPGDLFVDIGAWIGPVTLWALERGAYVIAIEPDPKAQFHLFNNLSLSQGQRTAKQLEIWPGAVTINGGPAKIDRISGDSQTHIADVGTPIESWTLEHILGARIPKLLKMDVEGYETELAPAIMPFLGKHKVPVQISLHGNILERYLFKDYEYVDWPDQAWGEVRAYNKKTDEVYRSRF